MSTRRAIAIGLLGLLVNCLGFGPSTLRSAVREMAGDLPHFGDFTGFYVGACMSGTGADIQYDRESVLRAQYQRTGGFQPHLLPSRLPFYYGLIRPLCSLSYVSAHRAWMCFISFSAVFAIAMLSFSQGEIAITASLWSAPLFLSILGSQDDALIFLVLAGALWLRKAGRPLSAGFVLSLLLIKFHLFLLLPVLFLLKREFRLLAGALSGSAVLFAACFALAGRHWPARYVAVLMNPAVSPGAEGMPNLHGLAAKFASPGVVETMLTVLVVATTIFVIARSRFPIALGAALVASMLLSRHAYPADCAVLIPGLIAIGLEAGSFCRKIAIACLLPFPYWLAQMLNYGWVPALLLTLLLIALAGLPLITEESKRALTERIRQYNVAGIRGTRDIFTSR